MSVVQEAIELATKELLIPFEGYHKKLPNGDCMAYPDPATGGKPYTIGWGCTYDEFGTAVQPGDIWTLEKAIRVKEAVTKQFARQVLTLSPTLLQEPPRRLAAVISFCYNCGVRNYRISTFKKRVDSKDWVGAYEEILRWNKANGKVMKGLTRRRQAEGLFLLLA